MKHEMNHLFTTFSVSRDRILDLYSEDHEDYESIKKTIENMDNDKVEDVIDFLTWLAVERKVSASSQNQAFNALLFLFEQVLKKEFEYLHRCRHFQIYLSFFSSPLLKFIFEFIFCKAQSIRTPFPLSFNRLHSYVCYFFLKL